MCRAYADAYRTKLTAKKLPNDVQQCIDRTEEALDLFNLVLIRKRVNFEVEQSGVLQKPQQASGGWFSGWWGGGKTDEPDNKDKDIRMSTLFYFFRFCDWLDMPLNFTKSNSNVYFIVLENSESVQNGND